MMIANYITLTRVLLIFPILYFISAEEDLSNWVCLSLFIVAGITDHLDGFIARRTGTTSSEGALLDLIADKLLICLPLLYLLAISYYQDLIIPSLIIVARELIISSFRQFLAEELGNNPIEVSLIAKSKTTIQITAISFLIISPNFSSQFYEVTIILFWLAAYLSIHSLFGYIKAYRKLIK